MTDIWIYSAVGLNDLSISLSPDNGWGQIITIETEQKMDLCEG